MDTRKTEHVSRKSPKKGNREAAFFDKLTGSNVILGFMDGQQLHGKLRWVGLYSVILEQRGVESMYWKHALKGMSPANGRGAD